MKTSLVNDPVKGRGWARMELVFEDNESPRPREGEIFGLAVQRLPEEIFLQPAGGDRWPRNGSRCYLRPDGQSWDGRSLVLELGPDFTSAFAKVLCAFFLEGSMNTAIDNIAANTRKIDLPSPGGGGSAPGGRMDAEAGAGLWAEDSAPGGRMNGLESPVPGSAEAEEPAVENESGPGLEETSEAGGDIDILKESESGPADQLPPGRAGSARWLLVILAVIVLILALAGAAWFWFNKKQAETPEPGGEAPAVAGIPPGAGTAPAVDEADPKTDVHNLFRRSASREDLEKALAEYDGQPGAEDAVFLLLLELAPVKASYRTRLAAFFDPSDSRPSGTIVKDPLSAYDEYERARQAGDPEAEAALKRLKAWAEERAETDETAAELLKRFEE